MMRIFTLPPNRSAARSLPALLIVCILLINACRKPDLEPADALSIDVAGGQSALPTVVTVSVDQLVSDSIRVVGLVQRHGSSLVDSVGFCFSLDPLPTIESNRTIAFPIDSLMVPGEFILEVDSVYPGTYIRAFAKNGYGTAYGASLRVGGVSIITGLVDSITDVSAIVYGTVLGEGAGVRGICYSASIQNPNLHGPYVTASESELGEFAVDLTSLSPLTNYYVRAFVLQNADTLYGTVSDFTTRRCPLSIAYQDTTYEIIDIGGRCWMAKNLTAKKYNSPPPQNNVSLEPTLWQTTPNGARCPPGSSVDTDVSKYGWLYNFHAVMDQRGLCPTDWRVANVVDWAMLIDSMGGDSIAGAALKTAEWGGDESTRFAALPAGRRDTTGWVGFETSGSWWAVGNEGQPVQYRMDGTSVITDSIQPQNFGASVRCVLIP